jgi:ATP-dependent Lon protease
MALEARERVERELRRLEHMGEGSPESTVSRNYIETMLDLPWGVLTGKPVQVAKARRVLEEDHYALTKVKERVLEYLAVRALKGDLKGPILCLVGPPGVGKTSIARCVAKALDRKFIRLSLGGMRDEAEIRGHRRTYIGAMPGRIISSIRQSGASDPVFLLDEIDKLASDFRGDPASALLEALDPSRIRCSAITTWRRPSICRTSFSWRRPTRWTPFRRHCWTAWRSSMSRATPRRRRSKSRSATCGPSS